MSTRAGGEKKGISPRALTQMLVTHTLTPPLIKEIMRDT